MIVTHSLKHNKTVMIFFKRLKIATRSNELFIHKKTNGNSRNFGYSFYLVSINRSFTYLTITTYDDTELRDYPKNNRTRNISYRIYLSKRYAHMTEKNGFKHIYNL